MKAKYPGWRTMTGAERRNAKMHAIFDEAKRLTAKRATTLTKAMCYAAGQDAGNRSMRYAGRTTWNEADFNAAADEFARLIPFADCGYTLHAAEYELSTRK